ncbi:MAG: CGNR zinc finger domain-containing protein [Pseudomonadota bacterium]|nr:CGNR zinc finger domain-containing protein [Pseudomonadota bacterium]MEE3099091.1 CGNR zinc finger domain-containing protein [Pseudomonadota bacterium]
MTQAGDRPGGTLHDKTAPGALGLVHAFLNTWDMAGPRERFDTPERMRSWFAGRSLIGPTVEVSQAEFDRVRGLRDGLRHVLAAAGEGRAPDRKQLWDLDHAAEAAPLLAQFGPDGAPALMSAAGGLDGAVGRMLAVIVAASLDGGWSRMKICRNPDCQRAYYDRSKNRAAVWCSTEKCGNRLNARAFRARAGALSDPQDKETRG